MLGFAITNTSNKAREKRKRSEEQAKKLGLMVECSRETCKGKWFHVHCMPDLIPYRKKDPPDAFVYVCMMCKMGV